MVKFNRSISASVNSSLLNVTAQTSTPLPKAEIVTANPLSLLPLNTTVQSTDQMDDLAYLNEDVKQLIALDLSKNKDNKKTSKISIQELVVGYGITTFNPVMEASNDLDGKINSVLGNSFRLGLRFEIMETWSSNIMVKYDRYHSTLDHSRKLGSTYDFQNGTKTNREEITFHNNFTNTLGLELGLQKRFTLTKRLSLFTGAQLSPTYTLNVTGKTIINQVPTALTYNSDLNRLSLQGGLHTGFLFSLNSKINLKVAYEYNNLLMGDIFINNGIHARRQNTFSLMMGYKFRK